MKKPLSAWALVGFGAAVAGAAWLGAQYSPKDPQTKLWYDRLAKPAFNPPNFVFPVVWTPLYALMALSAWRIWLKAASPARSRALILWSAQLVTNAFWTRLFFGERSPKKSLSNILCLEAQIIGYLLNARDVDTIAAVCFLPYAGWVAFAALLNAEIVRRNPDAEKPQPRAVA